MHIPYACLVLPLSGMEALQASCAVRRACRSSPAATWPSSEPWPPSPSARRKSFHGKTLEIRARFGVAGLPPLTLAKRQRELERARVNIDAPGSVIHPSILPSIQPTCDLSICPSTISICFYGSVYPSKFLSIWLPAYLLTYLCLHNIFLSI